MEDKRKLYRNKVSQPYLLANRETGEPLGQVANISTEGFMIVHGHQLEIDRMYPCRLKFPEEILGADSMIFEARCVWCERDPYSDQYNVGFALGELPEDSREILQLLVEEKIVQR